MIPNPGAASLNADLLSELEITYLIDGTSGAKSDFSSLDGVKLVFLSFPDDRTALLRRISEKLFTADTGHAGDPRSCGGTVQRCSVSGTGSGLGPASGVASRWISK